MPAGTALAGDGFTVADVPCAGGSSRFAAPEVASGHLLFTARRGAFLRREGGTEVLIDGTVAYLSAPGQVEQRSRSPVQRGAVQRGAAGALTAALSPSGRQARAAGA